MSNACSLHWCHGKATTLLDRPATHGALTEGPADGAPDALRTARRRTTPNATSCRSPLENIR